MPLDQDGVMPLDQDAWERWTTWITKVRDDLQVTVNDRALFQGFRAVVVENVDWIGEHDGDIFCNFVRRSYVAKVALGIRRQVKVDGHSASLVRVLSQLSRCAPQLTFDFYLGRFPPDADDPPEAIFRRVSENGAVASAGVIDLDIQELERLTEHVEAFADREIAHLDLRAFSGSVTHSDLDNAVTVLDRIACKYIFLLTGKNYPSLQPKILRDWKNIFNFPLRQPGRGNPTP